MGVFPDALSKCLLRDLTLETGLTERELSYPQWTGITPHEAAAQSIWLSHKKKYLGAVSPDADDRCLAKFLNVNQRCENWSKQLETIRDELLFGELRRAIYEFWNDSGFPICDSYDQIFQYGRNGPGAAIGARGGSAYHKLFASPLTCTNTSLYIAYKAYIRNFPEWANAEIIRFSHYGEPVIVKGNRLSFVPKNDDISRSICVEPSLSMFAQLGFGQIITDRLRDAFGIDLEQQAVKNRELARLGSLSDGFFTIDLESASDSLSLKMLEAVLPRDFFSWLTRLRSPVCDIAGQAHDLHMVSTMGNGFTFPLQTMLFSCVVIAAARLNSETLQFPRWSAVGNFGVFGDDIIAPKSLFRDVKHLLELLGFQLNAAKSFAEGPFRESCGEDYFKGNNIRGVYLKKLDTMQDRFVAINLLNQFSARTGIQLRSTVRWLLSRVIFQPVPAYENDDAGIKVPFSMTKSLRRCRSTQGYLYRCSVSTSSRYLVKDSVIINPPSAKKLIYNPSGLLISVLQGAVKSCAISIRLDRSRYKTKLRPTSFWDYDGRTPLTSGVQWQRWKTAVYINHIGF